MVNCLEIRWDCSLKRSSFYCECYDRGCFHPPLDQYSLKKFTITDLKIVMHLDKPFT